MCKKVESFQKAVGEGLSVSALGFMTGSLCVDASSRSVHQGSKDFVLGWGRQGRTTLGELWKEPPFLKKKVGPHMHPSLWSSGPHIHPSL